MSSGIYSSEDSVHRCWWCKGHSDYESYHDTEWGHPVDDDQRLFEKICLEGFQAGLSWLTILRKRDNFRKAFQGFDFHKVAEFKAQDVKSLLKDTGIIRHRGKIEATINNARKAIEMETEFGSLASFFWQYEPRIRRAALKNQEDACFHTTSDESQRMSKELRKLGWKFVGPTTAYAFMQSMGMVNDHLKDCVCYDQIEELRSSFIRP